MTSDLQGCKKINLCCLELLSLEKGTASHSSVLAWRIPMGRGAWRAPVHGVAQDTTEWLSTQQLVNRQLQTLTSPLSKQRAHLSWANSQHLSWKIEVPQATLKNFLFKNAVSHFATEYYGISKTGIKLQLYLVGTVVKNPHANAGDVSSIPGLGRSPGRGNGNPCQYFCLENPIDRGAWRLQSMGS